MTDLFDSPPRIELDLTGLDGTTVTIVRTDVSGNACPVRSANPALLSAGEWVGYDYEAPFGVQLWYTATTDTGHVDMVGPLVLGVQEPWLIHPGIPALSRKVKVANIGDRTRASRQGVHQILGRENPIVITDGYRQGSSFQMVLKTDTFDDADDLRALLADGSPLLLQVAYQYTSRSEYLWVSVGDYTEHALTMSFGDPSVRWSLPCQVVDMPAGTLQATWTWADLIATYATWNDVVAAFPTWRDVVTDTPG